MSKLGTFIVSTMGLSTVLK